MVRRADWSTDEAAIAQVRRAVFIDEQAVPDALEWEALDPECTWFFAQAETGEVVGIVRLTPDARIGRMAVLASWRRQGVGTALLAAILAAARQHGFSGVRLSAQTHAIPLYARFGFHAEGGAYQDAGSPHIAMTFNFKDI